MLDLQHENRIPLETTGNLSKAFDANYGNFAEKLEWSSSHQRVCGGV